MNHGIQYEIIRTMIAGYPVIIEASPSNYGIYCEELPGCVAGGDTLEEAIQNMREIIPLHLEAMREAGLPIPPPHPFTANEDTPVLEHAALCSS